jgi:phosphosulfolactate synthase
VAPAVLISHLEQSAHLMLSLKISMACWMIATESATRQKVAAARSAGVSTSTGGGPYEVALAQRRLPEYLDLCGDIGFNGIECGAGFTTPDVNPHQVVQMATGRGLTVEYELGRKHGGEFRAEMLPALVDEGRRWLDAGARRLVVEARESAAGVERLAEALGLASLVFEAPSKRSQFALLAHFGPKIALANVPLDELLRVEIYRRGLHSDAFAEPNLRPSAGRACSAGLSR